MKTLVLLLLLTVCAAVSASAAELKHGKRKKLRRKILVVKEVDADDDDEAPLGEGEVLLDEQLLLPEITADQQQGETDPQKLPRGFLDEYYSQFEERILKSQELQKQQELQLQRQQQQQRLAAAVAAAAAASETTSAAAAAKSANTLQKRINAIPLESTKRRNNEEYHNMQRFLMPQSMMAPSEEYNMYALPSNQVQSIMADKALLAAEYGGYPSGSETSAAYLPAYSFEDEAIRYESDTTTANDPISRFFGITGTTSQDIQLGLTFTVPFLSFPLTSLNSMLSGSGTGDLFNFNTESLMIVGAIALFAIFVLPQIVYWATGVNLSAFNWGRNDDANALSSLANMVDEALEKYDVDVRSCFAKTLCKQIKKRSSGGSETTTTGLIGNGLLQLIAKNNMVQDYMGTSRMDQVLSTAYGNQDCEKTYKSSSCPWDLAPMTKFATKLITSRRTEGGGSTTNLEDLLTVASAVQNSLYKTPKSL